MYLKSNTTKATFWTLTRPQSALALDSGGVSLGPPGSPLCPPLSPGPAALDWFSEAADGLEFGSGLAGAETHTFAASDFDVLSSDYGFAAEHEQAMPAVDRQFPASPSLRHTHPHSHSQHSHSLSAALPDSETKSPIDHIASAPSASPAFSSHTHSSSSIVSSPFNFSATDCVEQSPSLPFMRCRFSEVCCACSHSRVSL